MVQKFRRARAGLRICKHIWCESKSRAKLVGWGWRRSWGKKKKPSAKFLKEKGNSTSPGICPHPLSTALLYCFTLHPSCMSLWAEILSKSMFCTLLIVGTQNWIMMKTLPVIIGLTNKVGDIMPHRRGLMRCQFSGFIHVLPGCARPHSKPESINNIFSIFIASGKHWKITLGSRWMGGVTWLTLRVQGNIILFIMWVNSKSACLVRGQGLSWSLSQRKSNLNAVSIDFILPLSRWKGFWTEINLKGKVAALATPFSP